MTHSKDSLREQVLSELVATKRRKAWLYMRFVLRWEVAP